MNKTLLIFLVACSQVSFAQFRLEHLNRAWDVSENSEFNKLFTSTTENPNNCPFPFNKNIEAPDGLELELDPFTLINGLENRCMQTIHHSNCDRHGALMNLVDLYLPLFEQHLKRASLDPDLAFLPLVLSGLNSSYNESNGRAGLWALNYVEAAKLGLKMDQYVDERLGADPSTRAAIEILKSYNEKFKGDQIMTLAAFVKGERWTKSRSKEEISRDTEMAEFFCSLKICIRLYKNFERENQLKNWLHFLNKYEVVGTVDSLPLASIISVLKLNSDEIYAMNPVLIGTQLPAKYRTVPMMIPKEKVDEFNNKIEEIKNHKQKPETPKSSAPELGSEQFYKVKSGDVLGVIAEKLGVRLSQLRAWNSLNGDRIYAGQKLVYYSSNTPKEPTLTKEAPVLSTDWVSYIVKPGESLWLIAKKFKGVSAENIMIWNEIDNNIKPGQKLKIYNQ